jgi:PAS domain-containing protein
VNDGERQRTLSDLRLAISGTVHPCDKRSHVRYCGLLDGANRPFRQAAGDNCRRQVVHEFRVTDTHEIVRQVRSSTANHRLKVYPCRMMVERLSVASGRPMSDGKGHQADLPPTHLVVSSLPWGVAIITAQREILFVNDRGRSFLASRKGIEERGGRFHLENQTADDALNRLIHSAISAEPECAGRIEVPDRDGRVHFVIRVLPCRTDENERAALFIMSE